MFAAASSKRGGEDNEAESQKRLKTISIPQQFGWTGLKSTTGGSTLALEGLVLWNVLGFAMADEHEYARYALVNKEWNTVVQKLIPLALLRMKAAMERPGHLTLEHVALLKMILPSLEDKESPLYRRGSTSKEGWSHLQPQFNLILMRFVIDVATQRNPTNWSRDIYILVCEYLQAHSHKMFQKMMESLGDTSASLEEKLEGLLEKWNDWNAVVGQVDGIASYLNRYYTKHHDLITIKEHAQVHLEQELMQSPDNKTKIEFFLGSVRGSMESIAPSVLVRAFCATKLPIPRSPVLHQWNYIKEEYGSIKTFAEDLTEEQKESVQEEDEGTGITILFPDGTKLEASTHFVKSSGFLKNLKLDKGDILRWDRDAEKDSFAKAIEFYTMDELNPMTPIQTPLRSANLSVVVGDQYDAFAQSMQQAELFSLIALVNVLDTKKLLDLTVCAVSILIRGRSAAELRQIFNVRGEN